MQTLTIREALLDESTLSPGYVYVVRDEDVILYVGKSQNPTYRLCQHLGMADAWGRLYYSRNEFLLALETQSSILTSRTFFGSSVGTCIRDNAPASLTWSFDIYEKQDAIAIVIRVGLAQMFPRMVEIMEMDWYGQSSFVETILIDELMPILNSQQNTHQRMLPEKYTAKHSHTRPESSSAQFLEV